MNDLFLGILIAAPLFLVFVWIWSKGKSAPYEGGCGCGCPSRRRAEDGKKPDGCDSCPGDKHE